MVSSPQVLFGRHQCAHQTLRCTFTPDNTPTTLTDLSQQIQDVKDKLVDLIPWVEKLKASLTKVDVKDDREEVERRTQLAKFAP